jgi:hypothetical protein
MAGVLGVVAAIAGAAGLIARPDAVVWATAPLDRAVVVIPPQVIAMHGVMDIVVVGSSASEIRSARPADAYGWLRGESSIVVQGVTSWTDVKTLRPDLYTYDGKDLKGDMWRSNKAASGEIHIRPGDFPPGLAVVVVTSGHTPLTKVSIELSRNPGYEWAWPAISAGALLAAVSMVLFAMMWLDLRPSKTAKETETLEPPADAESGTPPEVEAKIEPETELKAEQDTDLDGAPEPPNRRMSRRARRAAAKEEEL